jgi:hypothetical protein
MWGRLHWEKKYEVVRLYAIDRLTKWNRIACWYKVQLYDPITISNRISGKDHAFELLGARLPHFNTQGQLVNGPRKPKVNREEGLQDAGQDNKT